MANSLERLGLIAAIASLLGCAAQPGRHWVNDTPERKDINADIGQCQAQAWSVPGADAMQTNMVINACMRGKGWTLK